MSSFGSNFITTGIVATPGEVIEVYVEGDKDEPLPQIIFSQSQGHYGKWRKNYQLKPGYNKFVVPEIFDENWAHKANKGGAIYLLNPYTSKDQKKAPIVSIEVGQKFPVFNKGDNQAEFIEELKAYKKYMDENPNTAVDIYEFNSDRILFTGTASDAYQVYVNEGVDIEESIDTWSSRFDEGLKFAGLEDNSENIKHDSTNLRTPVRIMQPFGAAYAAGDHIGLQKHVADDFLRPDKKSVRGIAWGTMHEMGHQTDIRPRTWGEVTNNMWANDVYIKEGFGCKLDYNYVDKTVALNHNFEEQSGTNLAMFWQLETYKSGYWASLERMYREKAPNPKDYQEKKDILALYSSEIIGMNLTEYYERYGFTLSESAKNELSKLPDLDKKIWYIHSNAIDYRGNGYNENLEIKVNSKINEEAKTNTLSFEMDEKNQDAFLGYEISKDGVVIGFSRTNSFVVENIDINENAKYDIVPYDLKLNRGKSIIVNSFKPIIKSDEKITLEVNEKFDLKEYVVATNYKGEKLYNIEINHNVDTSKAGKYKVEYKVVDNEIEETTSMEVEVVSEYGYLSDFEWKSVSTQYGTPRKNSNIKLRRNGEIKEYEKGFGIHANGEIVYDLQDKNYDNFEALLGVDMGIESQDRSSIGFKISVDGKVVETTKVLKHKDDAVYVNLHIKGAKELKIVMQNLH
ncbi:MAG: NPCBM/NEW2 domain-containing protein [Peptostreptococcaceae bacterium]